MAGKGGLEPKAQPALLSIDDGGSISAPRIEENGILKDSRFLQEGEPKPVTLPIADAYTNAVVDAVAPSMN